MSAVGIERRPPVRLVTFDTGRRNVLTLEAVEALENALAPDPEAPVVVLRGRPDAFCSGLDNATLGKGGLAREELLAAMGELLLLAVAGPTRIVVACELHELTVLGRTLGPEQATAAGFLDVLVEGDALQDRALEDAHEIAGLTEAAYLGTLASLRGQAIGRIERLVEQQARRREAARADTP